MRSVFERVFAVVTLLAACGGGTDPKLGTGGLSGQGGDGSGRAGTPGGATGGSTAAGGRAGVSTGGGHATGGDTATGGGTTNATGGNSATGGATGNASGGNSAGGAPGGATGGSAIGGSNGEPVGCGRPLLRSAVDTYFKALAAKDPSMLPTAATVKFTENGKTAKLGESGLWKNAGSVKYSQSALDTELCSSATQAVVPEGGTDLPVALRLRLLDGKITEIETIVVRAGDYKVSGSSFASNPDAIIAANTSLRWEDAVPTDQRNTRADLIGWIDKYYKQFPAGVCKTVPDCRRLENGGGNFKCTEGASCSTSPSGAGALALVPRLELADVETGIGVGFTMFMGNTDMHMFKMKSGEVYAVHAILGAATSAGWP